MLKLFIVEKESEHKEANCKNKNKDVRIETLTKEHQELKVKYANSYESFCELLNESV